MTTTDDCFKTEKKYINPIFSFSACGTVYWFSQKTDELV